MKIIFHIGVHCTDDDKLLHGLLGNRGALAKSNVIVPKPHRYRTLLRKTMVSTRGMPVSTDTQETLLDAVMDQDEVERVIFSNQSFLCVWQNAVGRDGLYPTAAEKAAWFRALFPDHQIEFHFAIRNPATFLSALYQRAGGQMSFDEVTGGADPHALRWSDMVSRLRAAAPDVPLTIWCDEDTPLIWPDILHAVAGLDPAVPMSHEHDILEGVMAPEGLAQMTAYLAAHPPRTAAQRRRIVTAFLDRYALDEAMDMELDIPGWSDDDVDAMTEAYDRDVDAIAQMPGVTFIAP